MKTANILVNLLKNKQKIFLLSCTLLAVTFAWVKVFIISIPTASATTLQTPSPILAVEDNAGAKAVDNVFGEGTSDKIEGKAKEDLGTVKKNVGQTRQEVEGSIEQAQGKTEQAMGEAKNRLEDAGEDAKQASGNIVEGVKDLFGK
ncbi:MAG: CsbD family protein [Prochloraceae cyanobacterium]